MGGPPVPEDRLIARARDGDARAFEELVRRHQVIAFRTAFVLTGSAVEAEDAAQDAFVKAWHALGRFRAGAPFRPWLLAIVAHEASTRRRSAGRRAAWTARAAQDERWVPPAAQAPTEVAVLERERTSTLLAALALLDPRDREVVELRHVLGLSEREAAAVLGCRPGTVKSRLSRALERLRDELGERP
jgi:RNA polymerase sigma-70 factor (ECF subfamily)